MVAIAVRKCIDVYFVMYLTYMIAMFCKDIKIMKMFCFLTTPFIISPMSTDVQSLSFKAFCIPQKLLP